MKINKKIALLVSIVALIAGVFVILMVRNQDAAKQISTPEVNNSPGNSPEFAKSFEDDNRKYFPNVYVANLLPYETETFMMTYQREKGIGLVFTVKLKTISLQQVQEDVNNWFLSEGLTQEQIDTLIIEYDTSFN